MNQDYGRIAGIDVHKKWLYVVVEGERRRTGTTPLELRALRTWLSQKAVDSVVMESTAQYWRPVWAALCAAGPSCITPPTSPPSAYAWHALCSRNCPAALSAARLVCNTVVLV